MESTLFDDLLKSLKEAKAIAKGQGVAARRIKGAAPDASPLKEVFVASKPKFKSEPLEVIHTSAAALHKVGAISKTTMQNFDETCFGYPDFVGLLAGKTKKVATIEEINNSAEEGWAAHQ